MSNVIPAEQGWRAVWAPHMTAHGLPTEAVSVDDLELAPVVLWYVGDPIGDPGEDRIPQAFGLAAHVGGLTPCDTRGTSAIPAAKPSRRRVAAGNWFA
jgi:hypothetical protein